MKIYEVKVEMDDDNLGITRNSFVDYPAVEYTKLDFSSLDVQKPTNLKFNDDTEQKFMSVSMVADTVLPRKDPLTGEIFGVVFTKDSINNIVNKFVMDGNIHEVSFQHTDYLIEGIYLVEHFITKKGVIEAPAFEGLPDGSWITTYYVPNKEQYNQLKDDESFNGFSIEITTILEQYLFEIGNEAITEDLIESIDDTIKSIIDSDESDAVKELKITEAISAYDIKQNKA